MLILSFDSTAKAASASLCDGERVLAYTVIDNGLTHSELLLPMAENLLRETGYSFSDIKLFACNVGPGSFTGVRIGVSLVKGLAFAHDIPTVPVSTLESLAENAFPLDGILCPVMDARRGQVYNALFRAENGALVRLTPDRAISGEALVHELLTEYPGEPVRPMGDGTALFREAALGKILVSPVPELLLRQNAVSTARVALRLYESGSHTSDSRLSPLYLRLPQAERERLEKEKL